MTMCKMAENYIAGAAWLIGVTPAELLSRTRRMKIVEARWAVMLRLHNRGFSYSRIGREMGMDHSTIMAGVKSAKGLGHRNFTDLYAALDSDCGPVRAPLKLRQPGQFWTLIVTDDQASAWGWDR